MIKLLEITLNTSTLPIIYMERSSILFNFYVGNNKEESDSDRFYSLN